MQASSIGLILISVLLTAASQIVMKIGMSKPALQAALSAGGAPALLAVATSPFVLAGMAMFGLSAVVWLLVLSKVPVSSAYPFVSLGIVITVVVARLWLDEPVSLVTAVGVMLIVAGVVTVALSR